MLGFTRKLPFVPLPHLRARDTAGEGGDFFELGEYVYGQDARLLSPTACLKHQKPMVKVFQSQALSYLHLFLLPSQSLLLGTPTKLETIAQICELLLISARMYGLKPLLHYLDAREPKTLSTPSHIRALLDSLKALRFAKRATLHKATSAKLLHHLIAHRHQKGLGVVIGDFYKLESHAPIASLTCYTISMLPNLWYVRKYTGMKLDLVHILLKPALAAGLMGAVVALAIRWLPSGRLWTLVLLMLGIAAYAAFALITGALTREDLAPLLKRFERHRAQKKEE